jgi:hypothetical protein
MGKHDSGAILDANDVGAIGAVLLLHGDTSPHHGKKFIILGREHISGLDILGLVEKHAGVKVQEVKWRDTSMITSLGEKGYPENVIQSIMCTCEPAWKGLCRTDVVPTSEEVVRMKKPEGKIWGPFADMLQG